MDREKNMLFVRTALTPVFYRNFHCLADRCRDTCCHGWKIHFDKKDYLRLKRLDAPAGLREKLSAGVRRIRGDSADEKRYGTFDLDANGGYCPFLSPEGLCSIQVACGHQVLPRVCTDYPRRVVYSPAAREYSLSPSCEGVLQQLWELPQGIEFIESPLPKADCREMELPRGEFLVQHFTPIRRGMLDILQNRALTLTQRMLLLGIVVQRLQREDWAAFDPDRWSGQTAALAGSDSIRETLERIPGDRGLYITQNLKVLWLIHLAKKEGWIQEVFDALGSGQKLAYMENEQGEVDEDPHFLVDYSPESYEEALAEYERAFSGQEYFFENLMTAVALYLGFPDLTSREGLWKSYVSLCNVYSVYRFVTVLGCKGDPTKERLFHMIVMTSRATLHARDRFQKFQEELFQRDSSTLAHMAILLNG